MRTAVSIPKEVFERAELLATELGISRSRLYHRALDEFLARHSPERITDAMNRAVDEAGEETDPFTVRAARFALGRPEE